MNEGLDFFEMMQALTAQSHVAGVVHDLPLHIFLSIMEATISGYATTHDLDPIELGYEIADTINEVESEEE